MTTPRIHAADIDTARAALFVAEGKVRHYAFGARKALADDRMLDYRRERLEAQLAKYEADLTDILAEAAPLDDAFAADPWSRFFLVTNGNGHVHSSMRCSTCFDTTRFAWLPELSGASEHEAVAEYGDMMCTVCFPSAPTDPAFVRAARERAAAEAAKVAAKCPGSGTHDHDSSGLRYYSPRAVCNHCHQWVSVTSTGKLRSHKPKEATS